MRYADDLWLTAFVSWGLKRRFYVSIAGSCGVVSHIDEWMNLQIDKINT